MVTLLDPKNDYVYKRLFAGDADLTVALINDLRPDLPQVASVEILNPTIAASELSGKGIVLDVRARCVDGHQYNIEMQVQRQRDWGARSLFYLARLLSQQLGTGEEYQAVASAIGIHLLDFDLFVAGEAERRRRGSTPGGGPRMGPHQLESEHGLRTARRAGGRAPAGSAGYLVASAGSPLR